VAEVGANEGQSSAHNPGIVTEQEACDCSLGRISIVSAKGTHDGNQEHQVDGEFILALGADDILILQGSAGCGTNEYAKLTTKSVSA
jgi:hypothetical protein